MLILLTGAAVLCQAQIASDKVMVRGQVLDPNRARVAGATLAFDSNILSTSVTSDDRGEFAASLPPADYAIKVTANGFSEASTKIRVTRAGFQALEITLYPAEARAEVSIVAGDSVGYLAETVNSATKTLVSLRDVPQSVAVVTKDQIRDQSMDSIADVVSYVPGITSHQGENNRDQLIIRGNSTSADFFLNGARDDVQYFRDLYNIERVEALKGPNAMIFGRGGGGGVINRVTKQAGFSKLRELTFEGGSYFNRRATLDFDQPVNDKFAIRLNGLYQAADSFRDHVYFNRYGIAPSVMFLPTPATRITFNYEHFHDRRVADRGIPSFQGKPADVSIATYYGNPADAYVRADVNLASAVVEHNRGRLNIRNQTLFGDYDRAYQNFVPGAVTADKTQVALSAYNNATARRNFFNQTDVTLAVSTGSVRHTLLAGVEAGRQTTNNFRRTGFFNNSTTSILVPYADPTISTPVTFRQNATDANNHVRVNLGAVYAQDQIELSRYLQVIAGVRYDYFDLQFHNNRTDESLRRIDRMISPRAGVVFKPADGVSIYGTYSVSYLPSSGDQFSSLTVITQQVEPERFTNYEVGVKWDVRRHLALAAALYRQDRTNTRSTDPNDPTRIVQTGSQRTNGFEIGVNGSINRIWSMAGGYAYQDAFITSATSAAPAGSLVAQVPHHSFSLWNKFQVLPKLGFGLGVIRRSDMFAAIDNKVTLPGYTKIDGSVFVPISERLRFQVHLENVLNQRYYVNADGNNNISPGSPRGVRAGLIIKF
ncbi:MAG TPA: TonB-dependent siderophore receptor [Pyrinomonadaceae bacterium]|nr:TonB-dependent siderophore receptor [Pyrinomonadaceae bacterium]